MSDALDVTTKRHHDTDNQNSWDMETDSAFMPQFSWALEPEMRLSEIGAQIIEGIAVGESTIRLAARLHLSRQGVEYHVTALLRVMSALNRPSLISRAYSVGILRPGEWPPRVPREFVR